MKFNPGKLTTVIALSTLSALSSAEYVNEDIVNTDDLSSVGFKLEGSNASLTGNTYQFPESGHYCSVKNINVDFKAGEYVTLQIDPQEALENKLSLRLLTWGNGQYKGIGGRAGISALSHELTFDTTRVSVGFCRYHNKDYAPFDISAFAAYRTVEVEEPEAPIALESAMPALPVYPSCREYSQEGYGEVLVLDDSEPRSLQELFNDGTIKAGMTVKLRRHEDSLSLSSRHSNLMDVDAPWLTIIGEEGASIGSVSLSYVKNIRFTGLDIGKDTSGFLVSTYDTHNIMFDHNHISGGDDHEYWDAQKWQEVGSGIMFRRGKCSTAYKNKLTNLRMGISTYVRDNAMSQEIQSLKALIKNNLIKNISADFMRPLGSDITLDGNIGLDHYVSGDDGDANHDDFIQGFAYPLGTEFDNVKINNNFYQASTDPTRPYQSAGQGIVVFDGLYTNFEIANNTLISNHWHGITIFWGRDGVIKNNTVTVSDDATGRYMWVQTEKDKSGKYLPENIIVENNVANRYRINSANTATASNNVTISRTEIADNLTGFDSYEQKFDVSVKEDSYYFSEGTGSTLPTLEAAMDSFLN